MKDYQAVLNQIPSLVEEETKSEILDAVVTKAKDGMTFVETGHDAPDVLQYVLPVLGIPTYITSTRGSYMYKFGKGLD